MSQWIQPYGGGGSSWTSNNVYWTTTTATGTSATSLEPLRVVVQQAPAPEPRKPDPSDPLEWLRGRVEEITELVAA